MFFSTIRSTLLSVLGAAGVVIAVLVALQVHSLNHRYTQAIDQHAANLARNQVVRTALAVARERTSVFLALSLGRPLSPEVVVETDRSFAALIEAIETKKLGSDETRARLSAIGKTMPVLRKAAADALDLPLGSKERESAANAWFEDSSSTVMGLLTTRIRLVSESDSLITDLFGLFYLRTHTLNLIDGLMRSSALLEVDVARQATFGANGLVAEHRNVLAEVTRAATEVTLSSGPFAELLASLGSKGIGPGTTAFDADLYATAEQELRANLVSGASTAESAAHWRRLSGAAILQLNELQAATFGIIQDRMAALAKDAHRQILLWMIVLLTLVLGGVLAERAVLQRVVRPLERMRDAMLQLAADNFEDELPKQGRIKEIDAMDDALRVFKANGIRRLNLQKERLRLHGRLEEAYKDLRADLEAAAAVQASLLPQQAQLCGVSFSSYFRPSNFLAGDTFDVFEQPDGKVIVFQIDVAGHGAAAALVSVAAKYTVAQAILQRRAGTDLASLTAEINREWPSDLPYFTLILAEIDHASALGTLVQAGHPHPILLRSNGEFSVLGDGGLPVGVLASATYETVSFAFGPNDRLVIATDGVHEMPNRCGELFSEKRVQDLVSASVTATTEQILEKFDTALRAWRGDDILDDDVTIVILEGKQVNEFNSRNERRTDDPQDAGIAA